MTTRRRAVGLRSSFMGCTLHRRASPPGQGNGHGTMSKPTDDDYLMDWQMRHVEGLGDIPVFDLRKPVEETLREIADNWSRAEEKAVAQFRADNPKASAGEEAAFRLLVKHEIRCIAMGYR